MKFGLTSTQFEFILNEIVIPLMELQMRVYCYGSRARGDHQKYSDLDLMIEGEPTGTLPLGALREKLQNSNLPFKVDLVLLSEFANAYRPSYEKDRVLFA